jgi:hypothetical protein
MRNDLIPALGDAIDRNDDAQAKALTIELAEEILALFRRAVAALETIATD